MHEAQDRASLEMGRRIAAELARRPEWLALARANLERWSRRNADAPGLLRCYDEWKAILERPLAEIIEILSTDTEENRRLRQNSPFAGALTPQEVWEIKRKVRNDQSAA